MSVAQAAFTLEDTAAAQLSRPIHVGGDDPAYLVGGILFDFLRKTFCKFTVNQKVKSEGPADNYPQGAGIHVFGTTTDLEVASNGHVVAAGRARVRVADLDPAEHRVRDEDATAGRAW